MTLDDILNEEIELSMQELIDNIYGDKNGN